jgi:hypothetical protein
MALAMLYPKAERGRGKKDVETTGFSKSRLDQARAVLRYSPELGMAVRDGARAQMIGLRLPHSSAASWRLRSTWRLTQFRHAACQSARRSPLLA